MNSDIKIKGNTFLKFKNRMFRLYYALIFFMSKNRCKWRNKKYSKAGMAE